MAIAIESIVKKVKTRVDLDLVMISLTGNGGIQTTLDGGDGDDDISDGKLVDHHDCENVEDSNWCF